MLTVSVIVPVFNTSSYLSRCIDSIINQTYRDIEIILIDDGSTDDSAEICKEYASIDSRIKYFFQENSGPDYARKRGLDYAKGEYLVFVDSDDFIAPNMIEALVKYSMKEKCEVVCSQYARINAKGNIWYDDNRLLGEKVIITDIEDKFKHYFETRLITGSYCSKLFKRELLEHYRFINDSVIGEDISFILYIIQVCSRICIVSDVLYFYYWNGSSISHSGYTARHGNALTNYINTRNHILDKTKLELKYVVGFFAEYEMAVATAMSRNWNIDNSIVDTLREDLVNNFTNILSCEKTSILIKISVALFIFWPKCFMRLYRCLYLVTGR